jgi:hypothetical protein
MWSIIFPETPLVSNGETTSVCMFTLGKYLKYLSILELLIAVLQIQYENETYHPEFSIAMGRKMNIYI